MKDLQVFLLHEAKNIFGKNSTHRGMCFDSQSSLLAWTLSYTIAWYLFNRNKNMDRWFAGFIIIFSSIQLLEAGIWTSLENSNGHHPEINDLLTRLILVVLMLQPFFQNYLGYRFTKSKILGLYALLTAGMVVYALYRVGTSTKGQFSSSKGPNGHLIWNDSKSPGSFLGPVSILYTIGLFLPLFFIPGGKGWPLIAIGVITAIFSFLKASPREFSSYWCFIAVAVSITALFM